MVEGVASMLDPNINMWDVSGPFVKEWLRGELGPEAWLADRIHEDVRTLLRLPDLLRRIEASYPVAGAAPPPPPLREVQVMRIGGGWRYLLVAALAAAAGAGAMHFF
jgi:ubiquinone biosynthesis protein